MSDPTISVRINDRQRELLARAERHAYRELPGGESLDLFVFSPDGEGDHQSGDHGLPAIVFFYGGGFWERGEVSQFAPQCLHFVGRGMVAILADYRLGKKRGVTPMDGVEDAREVVAWIVANAGRLGIDLQRLVLGGASSGAHVVLASIMAKEDLPEVIPAGLVCFSPIVNVLRDRTIELFGDKRAAKLVSPLHQVRKELPPMLLFHGTDDRVQFVGDVELFAKKMVKKRNHCELNLFMGERSSYFNFNVNANLYEATLNTVDDFLVRLGVLDGGGSGVDGGATTRLDSWR